MARALTGGEERDRSAKRVQVDFQPTFFFQVDFSRVEAILPSKCELKEWKLEFGVVNAGRIPEDKMRAGRRKATQQPISDARMRFERMKIRIWRIVGRVARSKMVVEIEPGRGRRSQNLQVGIRVITAVEPPKCES